MLNKTTLIGRIGQLTPAATSAGKSVMQFTMATSKSYKDKETGDWKELTEWHRLVSFEKCADHIRTKLNPGDLIYIEGELRTRKWQAKQSGETHYITDIVVRDFPKKLPRYYTKAENEKPASTQQANNSDQGYAQSGPSFDDDIPF